MKIKFSTSEIYPVYGQRIWTKPGTEIDIEQKLWEDYLKSRDVFEDLLDKVDEVVLSQHRNGI